MLIRGLPDVVTLLNGRQVFTTTGRFMAVGDIPANLVQKIEVFNASHIEGGIAGTINVNTRNAFGNPGTHFNINLRAPYNDKSDKLNPNIASTLSRSIGGRETGSKRSETIHPDDGAGLQSCFRPCGTADSDESRSRHDSDSRD